MKETPDVEAKRYLLDDLTLQEQLQLNIQEIYSNMIGEVNDVITHNILTNRIIKRLTQLKEQNEIRNFNIIDDDNVITTQVQQIASSEIIVIDLKIGE